MYPADCYRVGLLRLALRILQNVFFRGISGVTSGIIIRVSGVRVPPPLLHPLHKQRR